MKRLIAALLLLAPVALAGCGADGEPVWTEGAVHLGEDEMGVI